RGKGVDRDAVGRNFQRDRLGEADDPALGRHDRRAVHAPLLAGDTGHVDDPPPATTAHTGYDGSRAVHSAHDDDVENLLPVLVLAVLDRTVGTNHRVVDENIDAAELLLRLGDRLGDRGAVGDVSRTRQRLPALVLDLFHDPGNPFFVAGVDGDRMSRFGKLQSHRAPDIPGCTRNKGNSHYVTPVFNGQAVC